MIIDTPQLKYFQINDCSRDDCLIECMNPSLAMASVLVTSHPNELFLRSLSSVLFLNMTLFNATVSSLSRFVVILMHLLIYVDSLKLFSGCIL